MLLINFSSAFNTIIPQQLINKLSLLGLNNSLCNWILDFLTGRPQSVRVGHNTSSTTTLSTGAPQGCVLSPLLFTLLTHDCTAKFSSNHIIKFADDTSVVGLISNNDETHYREEVAQLAEWCGTNNLSLNVEKTKEVVMDFRRNPVDHPPLTIDTSTVERVSSTKFLGVHITEDLTWTTNTKSISGDHIMHSTLWVYSFCMACFLNTPDSDHLLLKRGLNKLSFVSERRNIQKCAERRVPRIRIKKLLSKLIHLISIKNVIQVYLSLNIIKASWGFSYSHFPLVI